MVAQRGRVAVGAGATPGLAGDVEIGTFLKKLGTTAQREIELAVRDRVANGAVRGDETLPARATVRVEGLGRDVVIEGEIALV